MARCKIYRLHNFMRRAASLRVPFLPNITRKYMRAVYACDLPWTVELGPGVRFPHNGLGVVIHEAVRIGGGTVVYQNVTLGGNGRSSSSETHATAPVPVIGNNVKIYAGAVVIGPINVGNNVVIGANAVVTTSVPDNVVVGGVPARILKVLPPPMSNE